MTPRTRLARSSWLLAAALLAAAAGCGGSTSGGGGSPPTPAVGESDSAGAPNLAFRTRTLTGTVRTADAQGLTVAAAGGPRSVVYVPSTVIRVVAPSQRSTLRPGACVDVKSATARGIPTHRTVFTYDVMILPTAACEPATASPAPGTVAPDTGGQYSGLLAPPGTHPAVVRQVNPSSLLVSSAGGGTMRVITGASTSYLALRTVAASAVQPGQCAAVFAQLPSTTLQALTVTLTSQSAARCRSLLLPGGLGAPR